MLITALAQAKPFTTPDPTTHIQIESDVPEFSVRDDEKNPLVDVMRAHQAREQLEQQLAPFKYRDSTPEVKSVEVNATNDGKMSITVTLNKPESTKDFKLPDSINGFPIQLSH
jgi:hypothetical protein